MWIRRSAGVPSSRLLVMAIVLFASRPTMSQQPSLADLRAESTTDRQVRLGAESPPIAIRSDAVQRIRSGMRRISPGRSKPLPPASSTDRPIQAAAQALHETEIEGPLQRTKQPQRSKEIVLAVSDDVPADLPPAPGERIRMGEIVMPAPSNQRIRLIQYDDVRLADAMRLFSEETGHNVICSADAGDVNITAYLRDVTPLDALEAIVKANGAVLPH